MPTAQLSTSYRYREASTTNTTALEDIGEGLVAMSHTLGMCAERRFHRIRGFEQLTKALTRAPFTDGIAVSVTADTRVAAWSCSVRQI